MKKLGKLSLGPEKSLKNEELIDLRGGQTYGTCGAYWYSSTGWTFNCNLSYSSAIEAFNSSSQYPETKWCCDSCDETWYCGSGTH